MRRIDLRLARRAAAGLALFAAVLPGPAGAQQAADFDVPGGHFFTQTGAGGKGYAVTDADGVGFWTAFQQLGGVDVVGYPVSQRFMYGGFVTQAMQKAVFQWRPESKSVAFVNVFDDLSGAGKDDFLLNARQTPKATPFDDAGRPFDQVVKIRQAALDSHPAMKAMYFNAKDPVLQYGLPTSQVTDEGNAFVIRLQRAVIQEWKQDVPWAKAGQATVANGGDIAKEAGLFPQAALAPVDPGAAAPAVAPAPAAPAAPAPAAPAAPAAQPQAPAGGGAPAPSGGVTLAPGAQAPYDTPIAGTNIADGRVNVIQTTKTHLGGDRIVGLLRNDTGGPVFNVKIQIAGSDANGNAAGNLVVVGNTYRGFMNPGEIQPFEAEGSLPEGTPYNVGVSAKPGLGLPAYRDLQLNITSKAPNNLGWLVVKGTVSNPSGGPRRNLSVVVAGYDAQGNVLDVTQARTDQIDLDPGQSAGFTGTLPAYSPKVVDVRASVEAYDQDPPAGNDNGGNVDSAHDQSKDQGQ